MVVLAPWCEPSLRSSSSSDFTHIRSCYHPTNFPECNVSRDRITGAGRVRNVKPPGRASMPTRSREVAPDKAEMRAAEMARVVNTFRAKMDRMDEFTRLHQRPLSLPNPRKKMAKQVHALPDSVAGPPRRRRPATQMTLRKIDRKPGCKPWPGGGGGGVNVDIAEGGMLRCFPAAKLSVLKEELQRATLGCRYGDMAQMRKQMRLENILATDSLPALKVPLKPISPWRAQGASTSSPGRISRHGQRLVPILVSA